MGVFFSIFNIDDIEILMSIQRGLSVLISIITSVSVYFLCKKFVSRKFAIIGATLIIFDPRLITNSFLGITDPIYLLLITSSLVLFLSHNRKLVYFSFVLVSLSTIVRAEGLLIFLTLSILFFIKYRNEKYKIFIKYILVLGIFMTIILPSSFYQIGVNGTDSVFSRIINSGTSLGESVFDKEVENSKFNLISSFEILIKYLIWIMIPNFILFIPLGIFLIFQKRNFESVFMIIFGIGVIIPAYYAYSISALDTRYLYNLFPIFAILSVISIKKITNKFDKKNIILIIIILSIILSSLLFYEFKKIDYDHEKESFEIMKEVSLKIKGVNNLPTESRYLSTIQTINQWPTPYSEMKFNIKIISYENEENLEDWILEYRDKGLTHIMTDGNDKRSNVLKELFFEEMKYPYLEKIYDSRNHGFNYQLKVFEINYELFEYLNDSRHGQPNEEFIK